MRHRLLIVDPAVAWPEDSGVREIATGWPGEVIVLRPALVQGESLGPGWPYDLDGIVVMGSRASVHDDRPWLRHLGAWLDPVLDGGADVPLLGICFGHQLIAHRRGAAVGYVHADHGLERGVQETILASAALMPDRRQMHVVVSHGEEVKEVPDGFRVTGHRERVAVDLIEHRHRPIFGVQFHPEARREFLELREVPPGPHDEAAFRDQAELLDRFRALALDRARTRKEDLSP